MKDKDVKAMFDYFIQSQTSVRGNAVKREVVFNFISTNKNTVPVNNNVTANTFNSPSESMKEGGAKNTNDDTRSPILKSRGGNTLPPKQTQQQNQANSKDKQEMEKQLQDLKIEYYKYKHQLTNLLETHKNLKSRVDNEKVKVEGQSSHGGTSFNCIEI
jgi:hypothetical protein